jgi:solute carrier family 35 protein E3
VGQIWTNTMQKRYAISSTPLLYLSAPYQALTLLVIGPPLDKLLVGSTVLEFEYTPTVTAFIILSCCIAVLVNFSTFLVIGKCDAVTYQVRCAHPAG